MKPHLFPAAAEVCNLRCPASGRRLVGKCALSLLLTLPAAAADSPGAPRVTNFSPRGWHRGGTVEVEFNGLALKDPRGILFNDTDKIRVLKTSEATPPPRDENNNNRPRRGGGGREGNTRIIATLEISPDCPQGQHSLRLQTAAGLSDLILFNIGGLPTVQETEDPRQQKTDENGTAETAQKIEFGATVNGTLITLPAGMEQDWYRIDAKKGQLISAEAECSRLCSSGREDGFEMLLTVRDATGKVLASADSQPLLLIDPFVALTVPEDGVYYISAAAALPPENNRRIPYRLHAGPFRRPSAVYPAGGNPNEKLTVRLIGLPAGTPDKSEVTLPAKEGAFPFHVDSGTPTANPMRVLAGANALEQEPNDSPDAATVVPTGPIPFALNGILEKPGDTDNFRFAAKKGERLNVRLYGQALGSPVDAGFTIAKAGSNSKGNRSEDSNDDALGIFDGQTTRERLDPADIWSAPDDGEYVLTVSDTRGKGGPDFVYRVEFTAVRDGLLTTLSPVDNNARQARDSVTVGRGNRAGVTIATKPLPGANIEGEYELHARGLPAGVKLIAPRFKASDRRVPVLFEAASDAPVSAAAVELIALPVDHEKAKSAGFGYNQSIPLVTLGNDPVWQVMVDKLSLAVAEDVPFSLSAKAPSAPLSKNSETTVEITLTRNNGYTGDVVVLLEQPPRGVNGQNVVFTGDQTKMDFRLSGEGGVAPGNYNLTFSARNGAGNDRTGAGRIWAASAAVPLEVSDPWFRVKFARARIERGKSGTMTGTIERLRDMPGKATAALIRLPRGLSLTGPVTLDGADKVSFELQASDDALVGSYNGVACEIVVDNGGSPVKQIAGYGSLRVDPARKAE